MRKFICQLTICVFVIGLVSCKEYDDDTDVIKNSFRVKQIIEYDNFGEEIARDVFNYENERIVLWQMFYKNANGEMIESRKIVATYNGDKVNTTMFCKDMDAWDIDKKCNYIIDNNLIHEALLSRYGFPECIGCWKYNYTYAGSKLLGWEKFIKNENDSWEQCRKGEYIYENNKLIEYRDFVICEDMEWEQDYKRTYSYLNNKVAGWQGGTYNDDVDWKASQKIEYTYENDNISVKTYSVWDVYVDSWKYFGSLNYYFDENNYLVEETSSSGSRTVYEYEEGHGNASLLYYEADDFTEAEPLLKNAIRAHNIFPYSQGIESFDK